MESSGRTLAIKRQALQQFLVALCFTESLVALGEELELWTNPGMLRLLGNRVLVSSDDLEMPQVVRVSKGDRNKARNQESVKGKHVLKRV